MTAARCLQRTRRRHVREKMRAHRDRLLAAKAAREQRIAAAAAAVAERRARDTLPEQTPVARTVRDVRCGDCEQRPCVCEEGFDIDMAWLTQLADHDDISSAKLADVA
jgi:hypothetical protein